MESLAQRNGQVGELQVPSPLRLAYDKSSNTVVVASMSLNDALAAMRSGKPAASKLTSFNASTRRMVVQRAITTPRGTVNAEGMTAAAGLVLTGGYNTQVWLLRKLFRKAEKTFVTTARSRWQLACNRLAWRSAVACVTHTRTHARPCR